ncbi:VWA domain-containing protein [Tepidiforma flava]|uniref:VWA domain-containing protein n=1 Tax=Tepidiforma flava TaxID=3004094 RepID=A0ABY7M5J1_9CHLR|nr:vWA domain-containing protein [Tepidiforma flava]WBL35582.1 VWA domain-containing protein [Tepidiforma flava]
MARSLWNRLHRSERGQALPLFALFLLIFLGFVAMSIDVGRYVWARTQMQAAVDAAALAAAQSMPSETDAAAKATEYWLDNSGFIRSQGENVQFAVTYPEGNKAVRVQASARIPTWFARLFGVTHWNVSASGDAESQVLDIVVVFDISGSMCFDSFRQVESSVAYQMSPGRLTPAGGFAFPRLAENINATQTTIRLNDVRIFASTNASTNRANFGTTFNSTTPYWQRSASGLRAGMIMIDNEIMRITNVNVANNTLTVQRGQRNDATGVMTAATSHAMYAEVWANRTGYSNTNDYCELASYRTPTTTVNGPHEPFDSAIDAAKYFTTLFDSQYDKIGAVRYSTTAAISQNLTANFANVRGSLDAILWPAGATNIAHGLAVGRQVLDGTGKRANAVRVLVLLTDGVANTYCGSATYNPNAYNSTSCTTGNGVSQAEHHARQEAQRARNGDILIFTIGLGNDLNTAFLQDIATIGGGHFYHAPTTAQLDEAFQAVAEQTHIALVR